MSRRVAAPNLVSQLTDWTIINKSAFVILIYKTKSFTRAANFNNEEEALLVSLVNKYKEKIECRKTDMMTNATKMETWKKIANEFNSSSEVSFRDAKILKNKYDNIKKRTKKACRRKVLSLFGTGGGPPEVIGRIGTDRNRRVVNIISSGVRAWFLQLEN
ncbi:hypothetical protein NQ318_013480 [Aromia moschata]|uniref:Myb/SANT-like DNA-binding domain-containing protein 3 n=1 Tax=Aromia moschata TaxID=1265417 RepID=A0AAV8YDC5_9CUCU|nr:hypothetical protein NQ318_013480 [Aromia moschata]